MNEFQERVFGFICKWKLDNDGISPSLGQIAQGLGATRSQAQYAVRKLAEGGQIEHDEGRIKVVIGQWIAQGELKNSEFYVWMDTEGELSDRVERAIHAYFEKYGEYPAFVLVNPSELDQPTSIIVDRSIVVDVAPSDIVNLVYNYKMRREQ